jgi:prohibitin 2
MFQIFIMFLMFVIVVIAILLVMNTNSYPSSSLLGRILSYKWIIASVVFIICVLTAAVESFVSVPSSQIGIVTTFGDVSNETLPEGGHFIAPWRNVTNVPMGISVASASNSEAASKDLQSVHATLTVNFHVKPGKARDLFVQIPSLGYRDAFVIPATYEVFKGVVSQYTAEELITKRQEVSAAITKSLNSRLDQYHIEIQSINLVNFGFSNAFNSAIEEKVTASQKSETARRNLERIKFEADARISQAEGEAKAISIQAAAVEKAGGVGYVQLQAINKWNGVLPSTMAGGAVPFVNLK